MEPKKYPQLSFTDPQNLRPGFQMAAKRSHFRVAFNIGTSPAVGGSLQQRGRVMNFLSQTNAAPSEQVEQTLEMEIRGHADRVDDDVKLASNNLDALMRRMSLTSTREIDGLIGELKVLRAKIVSDGSRVETLAPRVHRTESVGNPVDENHFRWPDTS